MDQELMDALNGINKCLCEMVFQTKVMERTKLQAQALELLGKVTLGLINQPYQKEAVRNESEG